MYFVWFCPLTLGVTLVEWKTATSGPWTQHSKWSNQAPCADTVAILPSFDGSEYHIELGKDEEVPVSEIEFDVSVNTASLKYYASHTPAGHVRIAVFQSCVLPKALAQSLHLNWKVPIHL